MSDTATYEKYSMTLEWEPEGGVYVVTVPELPGCQTHGSTLEEAIRQGRDALESWVDVAREMGRDVPSPRYFDLGPVDPTWSWEDDDDAAVDDRARMEPEPVAVR